MLNAASQTLSGSGKLFAGRQLATPHAQRVSLPQPQRLLVLARAREAGVGIFGTKAGMTQIFTRDGLALPATVIALEDGNIVTQVCGELLCFYALLVAASTRGMRAAETTTNAGHPPRRSRPPTQTATTQCRLGIGSQRSANSQSPRWVTLQSQTCPPCANCGSSR